jgi:hypothetical protein
VAQRKSKKTPSPEQPPPPPPPLDPKPTTKFKQDVERQKKRGKDTDKLRVIIESVGGDPEPRQVAVEGLRGDRRGGGPALDRREHQPVEDAVGQRRLAAFAFLAGRVDRDGVPIVKEKKPTIFRLTFVQRRSGKRRSLRRARDVTMATPDPGLLILEIPSRNGFLGIVRLRWVSRKPKGGTIC